MSDEGEGRERSRGKDRGERKWEELGLEEREWRVSRRGGGSGGGSRGKREGLEHNTVNSLSFDC